jgi:hypothetical protein
MIRDNVTVVLLGMGGAVYVLAVILAGAVGHVAELLAADVYNCDEVASYLQASGMAEGDTQHTVDGLARAGECVPGDVAGEVLDMTDMTVEAAMPPDELMMDAEVYPVQ